MHLFSKTPSEIRHHKVSLAGRLGGAVIKTVTSAIIVMGLAAGGTALACDAAATEAGALLEISGGTEAEIYRIDLAFTLDDGQLLEEALEVHVIDLDFAAPDGSDAVSYIAPRDYMDRFGLEELLQLTAAPGQDVRAVNKKRFFAALQDASAEIDSLLSTRFDVPVQNPPNVLTAHAASITREILHRYADGMPEHVAETAKAARKAMDRLATSDLNLPGLSVRKESVGTPQFESGTPQFSQDKLKDF